VDAALAHPGTTLIVVNSICGCAAGGARPGVTQALQSAVIPDHLTTVFAGVDMEATARARELMPKVPPSWGFWGNAVTIPKLSRSAFRN
jgi:putative YphP/YqiW family bacilliredoxin